MIQFALETLLKLLLNHDMVAYQFQTWKIYSIKLLAEDGLLTNKKEIQLLVLDIPFLFITNGSLFVKYEDNTQKGQISFTIKIAFKNNVFPFDLYPFVIGGVLYTSRNLIHKIWLKSP